jgi:hypothetical protein
VRLAGIPVATSGSLATVPVPVSRPYILDALGPANEDSREVAITVTVP